MKQKKIIQTSAVAGLDTAILPKLVFSDIVSDKRIEIGVIGMGFRGQWVLWLAAKYPEIDIPPIDVYDAVSMPVICPLSEESIANNSTSVEIPDLTCGKLKTNLWFNQGNII